MARSRLIYVKPQQSVFEKGVPDAVWINPAQIVKAVDDFSGGKEITLSDGTTFTLSDEDFDQLINVLNDD